MNARPLSWVLCMGVSLLLAVSAWAKPPKETPVPPHVQQARDQVDWSSAGEEAVEVLRQYLMIPTMNPSGNEQLGVDYLGAQLDKEGIPWRSVSHEEGRASLIARLSG